LDAKALEKKELEELQRQKMEESRQQSNTFDTILKLSGTAPKDTQEE